MRNVCGDLHLRAWDANSRIGLASEGCISGFVFGQSIQGTPKMSRIALICSLYSRTTLIFFVPPQKNVNVPCWSTLDCIFAQLFPRASWKKSHIACPSLYKCYFYTRVVLALCIVSLETLIFQKCPPIHLCSTIPHIYVYIHIMIYPIFLYNVLQSSTTHATSTQYSSFNLDLQGQ